jgi:hypothetical protein
VDEQQLELESALRSRLQRDLVRLPVAPYALIRGAAAERLRPRARPLHAASVAVAGLAAVAMALVVGSALSEVRRDPAATAVPSLGPDSGTASAGEEPCRLARDRVLRLGASIKRVDRVEVKRMSAQAFIDGSEGFLMAVTDTEDLKGTSLCVVAVAGDLRQPRGLIETAPYAWAVFVSVAGSDDAVGSHYGSDGSWPAYFDALPNDVAPIASAEVEIPIHSDLFCGVMSENMIESGQGSGPNTFELRPAVSERTGTIGSTRFAWGDPAPLGTYVCVWVEQAVPMGRFIAQVRPGEPGYIDEILPTGFALPVGCAFVGMPTADPDGLVVSWRFDCGVDANRDARGTLTSAFQEQGWVSCGSGLANSVWRKDTALLTVSEGSGSPGEYPKLTQRRYYDGGGSPPGQSACP